MSTIKNTILYSM